ncbi:hypothetical protein ACKWTF_011684 [Chironomus riparius]
MLKFVLLLCLIVAVHSVCLPYDGTTGIGYITVCKPTGECFSVSSTRRTCINLVGGPFHSGNSGSSAYHCKVFSNQGCSGSVFIVGRTKTPFPWRALSYSCPWKC